MSIRIDGGYSPATHLLITMSRWSSLLGQELPVDSTDTQ